MKISVIVPVYNSEDNISRCIESVLKQSYTNIELILVNDGSKDLSGEICEAYAKLDNRIKVVHKKNGGVSSARNLGIKISTGEYIQFIDSDDYIDIDMCEKLINKMIISDADLVVCGYKSINKDNISYVEYQECVYEILENITNDFSDLYQKNFFNSIWDKLYKREFIIDLFDETISLGEDLIFNLNYLKQGKKIAVLKECLYNYIRGNSDSLSSKYRENMFDIILNTYKITNEFYDSYISKNTERTCINSSFISGLCGSIQLLVYNSNIKSTEKIKVISSWINNRDVLNAINDIRINKKEYKLICYLIRKKNIILIYYFYIVKKYIHKIIKNFSR